MEREKYGFLKSRKLQLAAAFGLGGSALLSACGGGSVKNPTESTATNVTRASENEAPLVGFKAPDFKAVDQNNNTIDISQFTGKDVLVYFWQNGCEPCLDATGDVQAVKNEFASRGLVVIPVANEAPEILERQISPVYTSVDGSDISTSKYGGSGAPRAFLIDENGVIRDRLEGSGDFASLEDDVNRLLNGESAVSASPTSTSTPVKENTAQAENNNQRPESAQIGKKFPNITLNWQGGGFAETDGLHSERPLVLYNYVSKDLADDNVLGQLSSIRIDTEVYGVALGEANINGIVQRAIEAGYVDNETETNVFGDGKTNDKTGIYFIASDGTLVAYMPDTNFDINIFNADLEKTKDYSPQEIKGK